MSEQNSRSAALYARRLKRPLDAVLAAALLILLSPLLLLTAAVVWCGLGSPVFFVDRRSGKSGREFGCLKFRTMTNAADESGKMLPDVQRMTALGRILRATSLDELPQLWNVVVGQMSLVGPRPLTKKYLHRYSPTQARRHEIRPGITGWAQVNGRDELNWQRKFELDVWYVDHLSWWLDAKILLLTAWQLLRPGEKQCEEKTPGEFIGSESG